MQQNLRQPRDIDSQRMQVTVAFGKGKKEPSRGRSSPRLLEELRISLEGVSAQRSALFPGKTAEAIYADTSIRKVSKKSPKLAGVGENVYPPRPATFLRVQTFGMQESQLLRSSRQYWDHASVMARIFTYLLHVKQWNT